MIMETRLCVMCSKTFRVMNTSAQDHCGRICRDLEVGGCPRKRPSAKPEKENGTAISISMTPSSEKKSSNVDEPVDVKLRKLAGSALKDTTMNIRRKQIEQELNEEEEIEKPRIPMPEPTMKEIKSECMKLSIAEKKEETPPEDSISQLTSVEEANLASMNLLASTATHLHGLMKGLTINDPEATVRLYDPHKVNAACNCAKQIHNLMRLQLDAVKLMKKQV